MRKNQKKKSLLIPALIAVLLISTAGNVAQLIIANNISSSIDDNTSRVKKYVELQEQQINAVKNACKRGDLTHNKDEYYKRTKSSLEWADNRGKIGDYDYTGIETKYEETRAANLCYSALFALLGEDSYNVTTERIIKKSSDSRPYNIDWTELERIKY